MPFLQDRIISRKNILEQIKQKTPDIIWVSIQPDVHKLFEFLIAISHIYKKTIIIGNIGSRWIKKEELTKLQIPIIIAVAQGEVSTKKLLELINNDNFTFDNIQNIDNLRGYFNNKYFETTLSKSVNNQNVLPSTNNLKGAIERGDIITVRTSSGCNFHCTYCSVRDINNGQKWKAFNTDTLFLSLQNIVDSGMKNGILRFIDDDTAVSLEYLLEISRTFCKINTLNKTKLQFGFATNAIHLYNPKDTISEAIFRKKVWREVSENGLTDLFLGLESGSTTQLRRLGKNTKADINYIAYDFAKELNINLEIGFIPIDPLMKDGLWKKEFLDNIKLAKYIDSYLSSPTWLATVRVYENSPLKRALLLNNLLGKKINKSNEYYFSYLSNEVKDFINNLGICLCDDDSKNGLYRLKRELKNIIRYGIQHSDKFIELIKNYSYNLAHLEFEYIENIILKHDILNSKQEFIFKLLKISQILKNDLTKHENEAYFDKISLSLDLSIKTIREWKEEEKKMEKI
jgi:radical SAM superfamily enzyme YgiQ (UPF0313 family)